MTKNSLANLPQQPLLQELNISHPCMHKMYFLKGKEHECRLQPGVYFVLKGTVLLGADGFGLHTYSV